MTVAARYRALFTGRQYIHSLTCQVEKRTNLRPCVTEKPVSGQSGGGKGSPPKSARRSASTHTSTHPGSARSIRKMSVLAFAAPTVSPALSRGAGPRAKSRTASVRRAMATDNKAPVVIAEKMAGAAMYELELRFKPDARPRPPLVGAGQPLRQLLREGAAQRSDETDALATALARIHCADLVSRGQPRERRAARAMLLRDYHPDKTGGSAEWSATINDIQSSFVEER